MKVEISMSWTKSGQQLCSTNVNFDQYHVLKKSNKTLNKHNCFPDLVRLMLISTFYVLKKSLKMKQDPKNDLFFNGQTKWKQLSKKELSNVTPASVLVHKKVEIRINRT